MSKHKHKHKHHAQPAPKPEPAFNRAGAIMAALSFAMMVTGFALGGDFIWFGILGLFLLGFSAMVI